MIIIDFSTLCHIAWYKVGLEPEITFSGFRGCVLNDLRRYGGKHKLTYGSDVVLAIDSRSWRKDVFPFYKFKRGETRDKDKDKWQLFFDFCTKLIQELDEFYPGSVVKAKGAEADDIIGVLCLRYAPNEKVLVVSTDGDMIQLLTIGNVVLYSPLSRVYTSLTEYDSPKPKIELPPTTKEESINNSDGLDRFFL